MKWSFALSALQTAAVLVVLFVVLTTVPDRSPPAVGASTPSANANVALSSTSGFLPGVDEQRLRQIVRDEIGRALAAAPSPVSGPAPAARNIDPAELQLRRDFVERQIEYYKSIGSISADQMQDLQREIARLDETGRREVLGKLVRAMNARDIKGKL